MNIALIFLLFGLLAKASSSSVEDRLLQLETQVDGLGKDNVLLRAEIEKLNLKIQELQSNCCGGDGDTSESGGGSGLETTEEEEEEDEVHPINDESEFIDINDDFSSVALFKKRKYVAIGLYEARIFDLVTKKHVRTLDSSIVWAMLALGDNKLIQASKRGQIKIWNIDTGKLAQTLQSPFSFEDVNGIALNKNQSLLLSGGTGNQVLLWDLKKPQPIRAFIGHAYGVSSVIFYELRGQVISGSYDGTIRVWNQTDGSLVRELKGHNSGITKLVVDEKAGRLFSASSDRTIKMWHLSSGSLMRSYNLHTDNVNDLMITEDGQRLVSSSRDKSIIIWDKNSGQVIDQITYKEAGLWKMGINPLNGQLVTTGEDKKLIFWPFKP